MTRRGFSVGVAARMRANPFGKITQMLRPDFFTRRNWDNGLLPHQQAETMADCILARNAI